MARPKFSTTARRVTVHRSPRRPAREHAPVYTSTAPRVPCGRCTAVEVMRADGSPKSHAIDGGPVTRNRIRCLGSTPTGG